MNKGFTWVGKSIVLGALLTGSVGVGGAIAAPFPIDKVLDQLRNPRLGQLSNKLPILLPSEVPEELTYPDSFIMSDYRYSFTLNRKMNVRFSARLKDKVRQGKNTQRVTLVNGVVGYYTNYGGDMGTTKKSVLEWEYEGIIYNIEQSTYRDKNLAIRLANSSIEGGIRNLEARSIGRPFPVREILSEILKYGDGSTIRRSYPIKIPVLIPDDVPPHDDNKSILRSVSAASYEYWFKIGRGISFYAGNKGFKSAAPGDKARIVNLEGGFQGRYLYGGHSVDGRRLLEWQYGNSTYGIRLPKGTGTLDDAIRIANSAIRGGDRTRQQPISNPPISSNNPGEIEENNSIPNAEGEAVELPSEENNQIAIDPNVSASPEIQEGEIHEETVASETDVNSANLPNIGVNGDEAINDSDSTTIPDASVEDGAIAANSVDKPTNQVTVMDTISSLKNEGLALASIQISDDDLKAGATNRKTLFKCTPDKPCIHEKIIIDRYEEIKNDDGSKTVNITLYNASIAPAVLDVHDSTGKIKISGLKFINGIQPGLKDWEDLLKKTGSGLLEPFICGSKGWDQCLNQFKAGKYGLDRTILTVKVNSDDIIRISHSSEIAFAYSSITTMVDGVALLGYFNKLSKTKEALPLANSQYSARLKEEILKGFLVEEIAGFQFVKQSVKQNPLDFINSSIEVFKSIPDELIKSATDGNMEAKAAGDTLDALVTSVGGRASVAVNSAFAISQASNMYAKWTATQSAKQKPTAIVIAGFE
jgi:hypothetical protein